MDTRPNTNIDLTIEVTAIASGVIAVEAINWIDSTEHDWHAVTPLKAINRGAADIYAGLHQLTSVTSKTEMLTLGVDLVNKANELLRPLVERVSKGIKLKDLINAAVASRGADDSPAYIAIKGDYAHLPWELLRVDGSGLLRQLLGEVAIIHYPKRSRRSTQNIESADIVTNGSAQWPLLFAYYRGSRKPLLPAVQHEWTKIKKLRDRGILPEQLRPLSNGVREGDVKFLRTAMGATGFAIRHFSCHGEYGIVSSRRDEAVVTWHKGLETFKLLLNNDFPVTRPDVANFIAPGHWLAFINCCHGSNESGVHAMDFAAEILSHHDGAVLASPCELRDFVSEEFADVFYREFVPDSAATKGPPIGECILATRRAGLDKEVNRLVTLVMKLYGNPLLRLSRHIDNR